MGFDVHWVAGGFEPGWHANGATTVVPGLGIDDDGPPDCQAFGVGDLCEDYGDNVGTNGVTATHGL